MQYAADFLDEAAPLAQGSHRDAVKYSLKEISNQQVLVTLLENGAVTNLADPNQFVGFDAGEGELCSLLLSNNGLHIELQFDANDPIGAASVAGLKDVVLESALTTIMDCEDSVAAVDAADKTLVYKNWFGLMTGCLEETFKNSGATVKRTLAADREFENPIGEPLTLPGRSLMLIRNVGHLMTTDAVLDENGDEIPEGFLDAYVTALCAVHDLKQAGEYRNSRTGSIYIVKPKMHGPEEVALTELLFCRVEDALSLPRDTIKVGVMDEERRTTANLKECIREVRSRLAFINTGFLDRTGDEIHTCMYTGPVLPKEQIKSQPWISVYEDQNVDVGLACGMCGKAQIGKGMWAKPDEMREMMGTKQAHLEAGANCAWVPSPTAATLHSTHYHRIDVGCRQQEIAGRAIANINDILTPPLLAKNILTAVEIEAELENNVQGILGYVVRWVNQGIGCSKVPDINAVGLMEDRATLRISSQHIANRLHHGICSSDQVGAVLERMAKIVDEQNRDDPDYTNMQPNLAGSYAFRAARELIFNGRNQPNGYTEPALHALRRVAKDALMKEATK